MSSPDPALTGSPTEALFFGIQIGRHDVVDQLVKQEHSQTCTFLKHSGMLAEVFVSHDHEVKFMPFPSYCEG